MEHRFNWGIITVTLLIAIIGLLSIYSASYRLERATLFYKQVCWVILGIVSMTIAMFINYYQLRFYIYHFYVVILILLCSVLIFGHPIMGAKRWLFLGPFAVQPSEFTKLIVILVLAKYFGETEMLIHDLKSFLKALALVAIPAVLIVFEPDLSTAIILLILFGTAISVVHVKPKVLWGFACFGLSLFPFIWAFVLKDYQKGRLIGFLFPSHDPFGVGYHGLQSKIAIGSGFIFGKGFLKGTQTQLHFLPEACTDFIFSVFAEEWGLVGCLILLGLYLYLFMAGLNISKKAKTPFELMLALNITSMFFWQTAINIAMALGLLPVMGVPLPFMSYGGSASLVNFISLGLLINIERRSYLGR